jgi:hypothetical protein
MVVKYRDTREGSLRWRLVVVFLLTADRIAVRYRDLEERWFDRYVKRELEAGKRPWFWKR